MQSHVISFIHIVQISIFFFCFLVLYSILYNCNTIDFMSLFQKLTYNSDTCTYQLPYTYHVFVYISYVYSRFKWNTVPYGQFIGYSGGGDRGEIEAGKGGAYMR